MNEYKPVHLDKQTTDGAEMNLEALYQLFPSCFTEAKDVVTGEMRRVIDWGKLRSLLGKYVEDGEPERYDFAWVGKRAAQREAATPCRKTLRPCKDESVAWDSTQNLYIEGDNLEVLKLLQNSYMGKVKMIYIDPPYNTGKDSFVYPDDYSQSAEEYDEHNRDDEGNRFRKNTDSNGRFHSDWCSMIYSRLMVARDFLTDDGVIYISIDDNELDNLEKICDEVFGADNHIETFNIQVRYDNKSLNEKDDFQKLMEYILIYAKNKHSFIPKKEGSKYDLSKFCYKITELSGGEKVILGGKEVEIFKEGQYKIEKVKDYGINYLKATWASGSVLKGNTSGKFFDTQLSSRKEIDGLGVLYKVKGIGDDGLGYRYFTGPKKANATKGQFYSGVPIDKLEELKTGDATKYTPIINYYNYSADFGNIRHEGGIAFNSGKKPVKMLKKLLDISNLEDDIVMDFFSGSASTAHAVLQLNAEDDGNRKFIMVQLPEETAEDSEAYKAGYKNICEIGKERIRRAGKKIKEEHPEAKDLDIGFRVFKCDESNYKNVAFAPKDYKQEELEMLLDNIKEERTGLDLLFDCMLRWGLELSLPYTEQKVDKCTVYDVDEGNLVACFDGEVTEAVIDAIAQANPVRVVFRDSSFTEAAHKMNLFELFKQKCNWTDQEVNNNVRVI